MIREIQPARFEVSCDGGCEKKAETAAGEPPGWMRYHLQGSITTRQGSLPVNLQACSSDCLAHAVRLQTIELQRALFQRGTPA